MASMLREAANGKFRSVVVFDKAPRAGSFFASFPVHRKLISINKKYFSKRRQAGRESGRPLYRSNSNSNCHSIHSSFVCIHSTYKPPLSER